LPLLSRIGDSIRSLSRLQRELWILGIALLLGLLIVPAIIWLGGTVVLGQYAGGPTVFSLLKNFFQQLASGSLAFWTVALGPYVLILVARLLVGALRGAPRQERAAAAPPAPTKRQAPPSGRRAPTLGAMPPASGPQQPPRRPPPPTQSNRAPPAPQPTRGAPQQQPNRASPQQSATGRRTPFIKSID
jgi:hypothetical protein